MDIEGANLLKAGPGQKLRTVLNSSVKFQRAEFELICAGIKNPGNLVKAVTLRLGRAC
jgi:hypothetical protein